ncbi:MAG: glycosyltransferase family 39 protein [Gemmataceae bacterium]
MVRTMQHGAVQVGFLVLLWAGTCLPNLGGATLWDIDEPLNAQAAREMLASGNWVVPTFNYELRTAKPVLLYWLQAGAYALCGVNETAARLPSALALLGTALTVYALGRRMFDATTGLLAAAMLLTCVAGQGAGHFANPDAVLLACTTVALAFYWFAYQGHGAWLIGSAAACGLAVLAKGPVGMVLPAAVVVAFLLWQRQPRRLFAPYLFEASLAFVLIAAPWYILVAVETKGVWLRKFLLTENIDRLRTPMENHAGSPFYYLVVLCVGLVPWAVFLGPTVWHTWRQTRRTGEAETAATRFLACWAGVVLVVFSLASTKLPNYILPLYPALALLLARLVEQWRTGAVTLPRWVMPLAMTSLGLIGVGVTVGMLVAGGLVPLAALRGRSYPGLIGFAWVGGVLLAAGGAGFWLARRDQRTALVGVVGVAAALFVAVTTAAALPTLNPHKPSVALAAALPADQREQEIRLAACDYFQPTLVFYTGREVTKLYGGGAGLHFLNGALPSYVVVRGDTWEQIRRQAPAGARVLARCRDLYINQDVVLVANRPGAERQVASRH